MATREYGKYGRYVDENNLLERVIQALKTKGQLLLKGETGTGKTFLIHKICDNEDPDIIKMWARVGLNVPELLKISAHEEQTYVDYVAQDILQAGETKVREQIIPQLMRPLTVNPNGMPTPRVLLIDEANFMSPSVMGFLHPMLDWQAEIWIPELSKSMKRALDKKGFPLHWFVFCVNPAEKSIYTGTKEMNAAFASRLMTIRVPYMTELSEREWLMEKFPEVESKEIKTLVSFATKTRDAYKADMLYAPITPRNLCDALEIMREFKVSAERVKEFFMDAALEEQRPSLQGYWEGKTVKEMSAGRKTY